MPKNTISSPGVQGALRSADQQLAAIAALAAGRLPEAQALLLDLLADPDRPVVQGQCRYCGCTDAHGCGIAVPPGELGDAAVLIHCSWFDDDETVCSRLSCIARYEREHGPTRIAREFEPSRIVRP